MKRQPETLSNIGAVLVGNIASASAKLDCYTQAAMCGYNDKLNIGEAPEETQGLSSIGAILAGKIAEASATLGEKGKRCLLEYIDGISLAGEVYDRKGA